MEYRCYGQNIMSSSRPKRARKWEVSRLTFLPNLWWEYLDWAKVARTVVDHITGEKIQP
jgi:hypothetical protein